MEHDLIVIGAGVSGCTIAHLAAKIKKRVLLVESSKTIGGHACSSDACSPFFHTDNDTVANFFRTIAVADPYYPKGPQLSDEPDSPFLVTINFKTIDLLYEKSAAQDLKRRLTETFKCAPSVWLIDLLRSEDLEIEKFGRMLFQRMYAFIAHTPKTYREPAINWLITAMPIWLSYCEKIFINRVQLAPRDGYLEWFKSLVGSPYIDIKYNCDGLEYIELDETHHTIRYKNEKVVPIVYTGELSRLFDLKYGPISYYADCPLRTAKDLETADLYRREAQKYKNLFLCGRLAEYRFLFFDDAIARAMEVFSTLPLPTVIEGRTGEQIVESGDNISKNSTVESQLILGDTSREIPMITVVIPTFHRADKLKEALKSAIEQTVDISKYDILIVDNEPDGDARTEQVIRSQRSPNIYYYRNTSNLGAYGNMNRAVELVRSKWVCMLHDDDWLLPDTIQCLYEALTVLDKERLGAVIPRRIDVFETDNTVEPSSVENRKLRIRARAMRKIRMWAIQHTVNRFWKISELDYYMFPYLYPAPSYGTLLNRDAYIEVGGMAAEYPCEDGFFMLKLARKYNCYLCGQTWGKYRFAQNGGFRPYDLLQSVQAIQNYREFLSNKSWKARLHQRLLGKAAYQIEIEGSMYWEYRMNGYNQCRRNYRHYDEFVANEVQIKRASHIKQIWEVFTLMKGIIFGIHALPHKEVGYDAKTIRQAYWKKIFP